MTSAPSDDLAGLSGSVQHSWQRFLEVYEPLRPDLYRYCRYLTRSPWDAEDLAQDALARGFVSLGRLGEPPPNPRAWLFRVASNLWIDQVRRLRETEAHDALPETPPEPRAPREAAGTLMTRLSPQERAALVLKDVFDESLEEIAETLCTTVGAIKAALSRGRSKLEEEPPPAELRVPVAGALDAFCDAFNARDLERLTALLLDSASVEVVGVTECGNAAARRTVLTGMLHGSKRLAEADTRGGIDPRFMQGVLPSLPRLELRLHRGEVLLLSWYAHADGEAVRAVSRAEVVDGRISRLRNYFFTPDFLIELCRELDVPCRVNGYRYCLPGT